MLTNTEILLGRTIAGYRLLQLVGQGGMGAVFLGQDLDEPQIQAAIKILLPFKYTLPEILVSFQARFMREAQAMNQLEHAHIVPMLSYGEVDGLPYIVMPYLAGGALDVRLNMQQEPLALSEIARYMQQLASALDYAHQHGIVHRDIKPANVLLDADNNVYLTDFGIARLFESVPDALDKAPTSLTSAGEVFGTPGYMSPELFRGQPAGPSSDIYALGIMLYRLVTGHVPFQGNGPFDVGIKHLCEEPRPPSKLRPELPEPAEAAMLSALAKFPSERFTSAGELARSFEAGITGKWTAEARALWVQSSQSPTRLLSSMQFPTHLLPSTPAVQGKITAPVRPVRSRRYMPFAGFLLTAMMLALIAGVLTRGRMVSPSSSSTALSSYPQDIPARLFTTPHVHPTATATATPSPTKAPSSPPASSAGAFHPPRNFTIAFIKNDVYAVDRDNNTVLWNDEVNGHVIPPLHIFGNTIYVATHHGQVYALRKTDGALFWSYATGSFTRSPLRISDGIVYLSTNNGNTYELRADNGDLLAILTPTTRPTPTPTPGTTPTPTPTPGDIPMPDITPTATPDESPTPIPGTDHAHIPT